MIFTAVGLAVCSNGGSKSFWPALLIILIIVHVNIFLITDYCKYLVKSIVIPYLEDDNQIEFSLSSTFSDDEEEDEDYKEFEKEQQEKKLIKQLKKEQKKKIKENKRKNGRAKK